MSYDDDDDDRTYFPDDAFTRRTIEAGIDDGSIQPWRIDAAGLMHRAQNRSSPGGHRQGGRQPRFIGRHQNDSWHPGT